jgi:hypothetical protein
MTGLLAPPMQLPPLSWQSMDRSVSSSALLMNALPHEVGAIVLFLTDAIRGEITGVRAPEMLSSANLVWP